MRLPLPRWIWLASLGLAATAQADDTPADTRQAPPSELVWSLGLRLKLDDLAQPGTPGLRPMIGLRYGPWRLGAVDGESWHRFGPLNTDNSLTYDWFNTALWRTSLSASTVNLQRDTATDALEPGRKTVRGKATIDYLGWPRWWLGMVLTQDLLDRGAGTTWSPSVSYRLPLSDDSTLLLSQSLTWSRSDLWRLSQASTTAYGTDRGSRWGESMDTSLTLRQRWKAHWSWFAQINRNEVLHPGDPVTPQGQVRWSAQTGVVYFAR